MQYSCAQGTELIKKSLLVFKCSLLFRMDGWMKAGWRQWPILTRAFSWRVLRKEMSMFASQNPIKHCNPLRNRLYLILSCHPPISFHSIISCNLPRQFNRTKKSLLLYLYHFQLVSSSLYTILAWDSLYLVKKILQRKRGWTLNSLTSKFPTVLCKIND